MLKDTRLATMEIWLSLYLGARVLNGAEDVWRLLQFIGCTYTVNKLIVFGI